MLSLLPRLTVLRWPVVAAIIVAALIVLSVLWCVFSCLCCGISLCTACAQCLTCGKCCGACGSSGRRKRDTEYQPMPPTPTPYMGYQPQPGPMMYANNGPQFATFDTGNKRNATVHEDSLPAMPSWDTATTRRVEDHTPQPQPQSQPQPQRRPLRNDMEMERMLPYNQVPVSPVRESPYASRSPVHESPYTSDIGVQNQTMHSQYNNNDYYDTPLSPAPTYYSTVPAGAPMTAGARTMSPPNQQQQHYARTMSPPQHYDTGYQQHQARTVSPSQDYGSDHQSMIGSAPYPASRESTQFGAGYSTSQYNQQVQTEQESGVRPPSLLQIGRKPVPGTYREV